MEIFRRIKLLVCDFDGVFTDNRVMVDEDGKESVICSRADGMGVELLKKNNIEVIVISKERNPVVQRRCEKMKIRGVYGVENKLNVLREEINKRGLKKEEVCYIGNDLNDLACIEYVIGVGVNDAVMPVKERARFVTAHPGGKGAVRELAELLLKAQSKPVKL